MVKGIISLLIIACIIVAGILAEINKDCIVKSRIDHNITTIGEEFQWTSLLWTREEKQTIHVAFVEKDYIKNQDILHVKLNKLIKEEIRNGATPTNEFSSNISLSYGWNKFSYKIENRKMNLTMNSYNISIDFEYPVDHVAIFSNTMSTCINGQPTWNITERENSTITSVKLGIEYFSLVSTKPFSPVIYLNNVIIYLQYDLELQVEIGQYNKKLPLPNATYKFKLEKTARHWTLEYINSWTDSEILFKKKVRKIDKIFTMKASSLDEEFFLELMTGDRMDEKNKRPYSTYLQIDTTPASIHTQEKNPIDEKYIIGITISAIIVILALAAVLVIVWKRRHWKRERRGI